MARLRLVTLGITALLAAACGPTGSSTSPSTAAGSAGATTTPATAAPTADACADPTTKTAGKLTIATDNPAYPPYFEAKDGGNTDPWDPNTGDPTSGKGFESAMAYAIADQMGFDQASVTWIPVAFNTTLAPGPKDIEFFIGQVN